MMRDILIFSFLVNIFAILVLWLLVRVNRNDDPSIVSVRPFLLFEPSRLNERGRLFRKLFFVCFAVFHFLAVLIALDVFFIKSS